MSVRVHLLHPSGVDVWLELASVEAVDLTIKRLLAQGYRPATTASGENGWPKAPDGSPLCAKHGGIVMSKRERQGDAWWSHRVTHPKTKAELYCRGHRHGPAEKDGYLVDVG